MEIPLPRRGGLTVALLVLLALGAAFAFYFFHYLNQRSEYLRGRNLRELATLARQIEDAVATWDEVAWNYARSLPPRSTLELVRGADSGPHAGEPSREALANLDLAPDTYRFGEEGWYLIRNGVLAGGLLYWPPLPPRTLPEEADEGTGSPGSDPDGGSHTETVRDEPRDREIGSTGIRVQSQGRTHWLSFQIGGAEPRSVHLRLSQVLRNLSLPEDFFDHLFLIDDAGRIVFRRTGSDLKLARLELEEGKTLPARSHHDTLEIAGRTFEQFTQPVVVRPAHQRLGSPDPTRIWTVAGLVSTKRLKAEGAAVSPLSMLVMLCLFLVLVLLVPVIKVWSLAPHERLRRLDLVALGVASTFAVALVSLLAADLWAYRSLSQEVDESLGKLSGDVESHLVEELEALQAQLLRLTSGDPPLDPPLGPRSPNRENLLKHWSEDWEYPWFHTAFWVDPAGMQGSRWTVESRSSPQVSVAERDSLRKAATGRLWYLEGLSRGFVLEPIRSLTTGARATVLAMSDPEHPGAVHAIATELISVTRPVLPADVGFVVVDGEGRTIFHSDPGHNGAEDFLAACDEDSRLQAALRTPGAISRFDASYQGRPHRLLVRQIRNLPLWLVVFQGKSSLHRLHLDLMLWILAAVLLLLLTVVVLAFLLGACSVLLGGRIGQRDWLVGSGESFERADLKLTGVLALLAGTLIWALAQTELMPKLILAVTLPPVALLFFLARVVWKRSGRRRTWLELLPLVLWFLVLAASLGVSLGLGATRLHAGLMTPVLLLSAAVVLWLRRSPGEALAARWRWVAAGGGVVASTLLFFLVVAALPTGLLFQVAWQVEWWSLVSRGQRHLAEQLETRDEHVQPAFDHPRLAVPTGIRQALLHRRLDLAGGVDWDRYESHFFDTRAYEVADCHGEGTEISEAPGATNGGFPSTGEDPDNPAPQEGSESRDIGPWLWKHLQGIHERLPLRQHRTLDDTSDGFAGGRQWVWHEGLTRSGNLHLHASRPDRDVCRQLTTSGAPPRHLPLGTPILVVLGGALFLGVIGVTARRMLTLDVGPGDHAEDLSDLGDHLLWTASADTARAVFPEDQDTVWIDLAEPENLDRIREGDKASLRTAAEASPSRVVFANLDRVRHDAEAWCGLLGFGEALVREHKCSLVFLTEVHLDPEDLVTALAPPAPKADSESDPAEVKDKPTESQIGPPANERLLAFLSGFTLYPFKFMGPPEQLPSEEPAGAAPTLTDAGGRAARLTWLKREAGTHPRLCRAAAWLARNPELADLSRSRVEEAFEEALELYYRWLWERSSDAEKRLLYQLAQEGLVNPGARDATRRLLRRGLVLLTPHRGLQPLNGTFRSWIFKTGAAEETLELERGAGGWREVRTPVYLALVAILLFLLTTQQDLFSGTLGQLQQTFVQMVTVLTALAGGLAGLTQLLVRFSGGR